MRIRAVWHTLTHECDARRPSPALLSLAASTTIEHCRGARLSRTVLPTSGMLRTEGHPFGRPLSAHVEGATIQFARLCGRGTHLILAPYFFSAPAFFLGLAKSSLSVDQLGDSVSISTTSSEICFFSSLSRAGSLALRSACSCGSFFKSYSSK